MRSVLHTMVRGRSTPSGTEAHLHFLLQGQVASPPPSFFLCLKTLLDTHTPPDHLSRHVGFLGSTLGIAW